MFFFVDCSVFFEFLILLYLPSPLCHVFKFTIWWIPVKLVQIPPCSYWLLFITWELTVDSSVSSLNSNKKTNFHEIWKRDRCSSGKIMLIHLTHNIILCYSKSLGSLLCTRASEPNIEPDWLWNSYQHKPSVETYLHSRHNGPELLHGSDILIITTFNGTKLVLLQIVCKTIRGNFICTIIPLIKACNVLYEFIE